ncbi:MAG: hypothetical protein ACYTBJ_25105 [Planctomycetota bacterium]|jgi:hypothetical protein
MKKRVELGSVVKQESWELGELPSRNTISYSEKLQEVPQGAKVFAEYEVPDEMVVRGIRFRKQPDSSWVGEWANLGLVLRRQVLIHNDWVATAGFSGMVGAPRSTAIEALRFLVIHAAAEIPVTHQYADSVRELYLKFRDE